MQIKTLHAAFDKFHNIYGAKHLSSIYGAGCIKHPRIMFVFMNPTGRNVSTNYKWRGIRAPWLGTKNIWKLFYATGFISKKTFQEIQRFRVEDWTPEFSMKLYGEIAKNKIFITNLAKCTQIDARKLNDSVFKDYLEFMYREIAIIKPEMIITFGNQVSSILLKKPIRVGDYKGIKKERIFIQGETFDVYPVYYPVGQGMRNMPLAVKRIENII